MRFLMLMYPGPKPENGHTPTRQAIEAMMKYNDELTKAGVLLALDGLQPTSKGARIRFAQENPSSRTVPSPKRGKSSGVTG